MRRSRIILAALLAAASSLALAAGCSGDVCSPEDDSACNNDYGTCTAACGDGTAPGYTDCYSSCGKKLCSCLDDCGSTCDKQ